MAHISNVTLSNKQQRSNKIRSQYIYVLAVTRLGRAQVSCATLSNNSRLHISARLALCMGLSQAGLSQNLNCYYQSSSYICIDFPGMKKKAIDELELNKVS